MPIWMYRVRASSFAQPISAQHSARASVRCRSWRRFSGLAGSVCAGRGLSSMACLPFWVDAPVSRKKELITGMLAAKRHDSSGPKNENRQKSADMHRYPKAAMAAVAFAENLLIRMPNCARKRPDETPETTPDAVSAMLAANAPAADSPSAQPAATGSSSVDAAMAIADPTRAGLFASQRAQRLCSIPMRICVSSSVQMDIR